MNHNAFNKRTHTAVRFWIYKEFKTSNEPRASRENNTAQADDEFQRDATKQQSLLKMSYSPLILFCLAFLKYGKFDLIIISGFNAYLKASDTAHLQ